MTFNASQLGTHFSYYTNCSQDLLGKGDEQTAKQAQETLGALAGIMALHRHTYLHNTPTQDDDTDGPDTGEDKGGQVIYNGQRIGGSGCSCESLRGKRAAKKHSKNPKAEYATDLGILLLGVILGKFVQ